MLTALVKQSNESVIAVNVTKEDGPFICKGCGEEAIVRKGRVKAHHFAHKAKVTCKSHEGESKEHLKIKYDIYNALNKADIPVELEYNLSSEEVGKLRADIYCFINNQWIAIEIQRSNITKAYMLERTKQYTQLGVATLWIMTDDLPNRNPDSLHPTVSVRTWMLTMEDINKGLIFEHKEGLTLNVKKFYSRFKYIPDTGYGGGYAKRSKTLRKFVQVEEINLLEMYPTMEEYKGEEYLMWRKYIKFPSIGRNALTDN